MHASQNAPIGLRNLLLFYQNPWNSNRKRTPTTTCQFPKIKTSHLSVVMDEVEKTGEIDEKESGDKQNQRNQQNIIHG
jgi:hypothetical protein